MDNETKNEIKKVAKKIGSTIIRLEGWEESEERKDLRKLRIKLIETKAAVNDEISNQPCDIGQILEFIEDDLKDHISFLNDIMGLDKNGNDKVPFTFETSVTCDGEIVKRKIKL